MLAGNLEQIPKSQKAFSGLYNLQRPLQSLQKDLDDNQQKICQFRVLLFAEPYEVG
jgi:hypothetical protein